MSAKDPTGRVTLQEFEEILAEYQANIRRARQFLAWADEAYDRAWEYKRRAAEAEAAGQPALAKAYRDLADMQTAVAADYVSHAIHHLTLAVNLMLNSTLALFQASGL